MLKLHELVTVTCNNKDCVIVEVKPKKEFALACLGYFDGDETMIRLTKGDQNRCTVWKKDGSCYSWEWGLGGCTCISDGRRKQQHLIVDCITRDFGIQCGKYIR